MPSACDERLCRAPGTDRQDAQNGARLGAIFAAGFAVFALREDFSALGRRIAAAAWGGGTQETTQAGELRIAMAQDGHFWVDGELNGQQVRSLVDSGATVTTIDRETAERAGIAERPRVDGRDRQRQCLVDRGRAERLALGPIQRSDIAVQIGRGRRSTSSA